MTATLTISDLPKRFDHAAAQPRIYALWEERGYFHSDPIPGRRPFTIVIPPPNVTGALHLGHALNNTLQDMVIRSKRMQGYNALWMPGTDHAGIATQAVVERRLREEENLTRHDLGRDELVRRIWAWKEAYEARILHQLKQMGCSCDWRRTRFTLDEICARAVRQTFFDLFRQQKIYRGKRLVNWDTFLQTAVSDDEVHHETVKGHFWHFRYRVIDPRPGEPSYVTIATTRPETMLGDTAVAVHPDPAAALGRAEQWLLEKLAAAPAKEKGALEVELQKLRERRVAVLPQLVQLRDMALAGRQLELPLLLRTIPLIADPWAKPEMGSGCVKITPAHDPNDYEVGLRSRLPMINILNPDGTLNANAGPYAGLTISQARQRVVRDLEAQGLLAEIEDREIDLAHSDRSKTPIEPYLADQWFVRMNELAQSAIDAVTDGRVTIQPSRYAKGYTDWLAEKRDWPVSRQLWWGHQIPIWSITGPRNTDFWAKVRLPHVSQIDENTLEQAVHGDWRAIASVQLVSGPGDDEVTLLTCLAPDHPEHEQLIEAAGLTRDPDVLDTWFSSALWPHSTLGWPVQTPELQYYYPTSVLITSRDIITLWVARMVLTGLANMGDVPFREVFIHPKILDRYGETMSKSKGNGVDPLDVIDKFGADALRFGLADLTTETQDLRMPVQFECPACQGLTDQTRENRTQPAIECSRCGKKFSTQWAQKEADLALPRGAVVSEQFEKGRNFCNKLWNASRFTLMNLEGYVAGPVNTGDLQIEDRWILSRLETVADQVTTSLNRYQFAEMARALYDFAWNEFCSVYVEMAKKRVDDPATRTVAQRVLAHVLDTLLRLLHPVMPFITEEVWQLLAQLAPARGLPEPAPAAEGLCVASWPAVHAERRDLQLETQFAKFLSVLDGLREIRSRQNIAPRQTIEYIVHCSAEDVGLLRPLEPFLERMAGAHNKGWGYESAPPQASIQKSLPGMELFVDLQGTVDIPAEIARNQRELAKLRTAIESREKKLANENFVSRAKPDVVQRERDALQQEMQQAESIAQVLQALSNRK